MSDLTQNPKEDISNQIRENLIPNCYISLFLNQNTRVNIAKYQIALYEHLPKNIRDNIAWVPSAWFGITLKYLGLVSPSFIEVVFDILAKLLNERKKPFTLESSGLHTFHLVSGEPRVLSLGFKEDNEITEFIDSLNREISKTGYSGETIQAVPRVTLGRVISEENIPFMSYLESFDKSDFIGEIYIDEVIIGNRASNNYKDMPKILNCYKINDNSLNIPKQSKEILPEFIPNDKGDDLIDEIINKLAINRSELEEIIEKEAKNSSIFSNLPIEKIEEENQSKSKNYSGESMEWETVQENLRLNNSNNPQSKNDNTSSRRNKSNRNSRNNKKYGKKPYNKKSNQKSGGKKFYNNKSDSANKRNNDKKPENTPGNTR